VSKSNMSGRANKRTAKLAAAFTQSQSNQPVAASILEESVVQADIVPVSEQDQVQKLISVSDSVIAAWGTDDKSAFKATCVNHVRVLLPARRIDAIGFENALRARADVGPLDSHTLVSHAVSFQSAGAVQSLVGEHMRRQSIVEANAAPLSPSTPSLVSPNKRNSVRGSTATVEAKLQVHSADGELIVTGDARFKFEMPSMLLSHMQIDETFLKEPEDATPVLTVTPQRRPSVRQTPMAMPAPTHAVIDTPDIVLDTTESSTSSKTSQLTAPPALPLPDTFSEIPATADDDCSQQLHHSPRSTVEPPGIPSLPLPCVSNQPVEDSPICTPEPVTNAPTITESAVQHVTIDESDKVLSRQSIVDSASIPVDSSLIEPPASVSIQPLLQSELKHETNDVIESADLVEIPVPTQQQRSDTTESNSQPTPDSTTSSTPDVMLVNTSESSNAEPSPPNSVDEATVLPLFEAAHVGNVDSIAHWLAVDQASVFDALDADSHSVLIVASAMGQDAVVKLLLTHERASIAPRLTPTSSKSFFSRLFTSTPTVRSIAERTDTRQWSPLMHAAANGHASVVRRLLMHISEVAVEQSDDDSRIDEALRVRSEAGSTALHIAAANGHAGVIQVLMEAVGNDSRARADYAGCALPFIFDYLLLVIILILCVCRLTDKNGSTALLVAAACGRERAAIFLASCCTDVDRADCNGTTALMAACAIPSVDLTLTLLRAGADAGRRDNKGVSPLMRAADKGDVNIVRALLSVTGPKAAEIDAPTKNGVTALMRAARAGHAACIISLLAARPPPAIDAQDLNGLTALGKSPCFSFF
jgi:ankyrin repeat protein